MKNILKFSLLAVIIFGLVSCLKDKDFDNNVVGLNLDNAPKVIEVGIASSTAKEKTIGLDFIDQLVDVSIVTVRLAAAEPASEDITVLLDTTGTEAISLAKGDTNFNKLPRLYTLPATGLSVTIPKGKREADLIVKLNASKFNPSARYGINFKLKSVNKAGYVLSANFNEFYTALGAKNAYDGVYTLEFTNYHPTLNPGYIGSTTIVHLVTTGPNTNKIFWPTANAFANPAFLSGAFSFFGSQEPAYTFNPVTNEVTVQNVFPAAATLYTMNPSFNSRYDAANRIVFAKFGYSYVGGTFALGASREWTQKFTYTGPR